MKNDVREIRRGHVHKYPIWIREKVSIFADNILILRKKSTSTMYTKRKLIFEQNRGNFA